MKIKYFRETDTLYIELRTVPIGETRDFDDDTIIDVDMDGRICGITLEHASLRAGIPEISYEQTPP